MISIDDVVAGPDTDRRIASIIAQHCGESAIDEFLDDDNPMFCPSSDWAAAMFAGDRLCLFGLSTGMDPLKTDGFFPNNMFWFRCEGDAWKVSNWHYSHQYQCDVFVEVASDSSGPLAICKALLVLFESTYDLPDPDDLDRFGDIRRMRTRGDSFAIRVPSGISVPLSSLKSEDI